MALVDDVKLALRISHTKLDGEIADYIDSAKEDMIRAGVSAYAVESDESKLIATAIKTYVLARMVDNPDTAQSYQKSYEYQLDALRKSADYRAEDPEEEPEPEPEPEDGEG